MSIKLVVDRCMVTKISGVNKEGKAWQRIVLHSSGSELSLDSKNVDVSQVQELTPYSFEAEVAFRSFRGNLFVTLVSPPHFKAV